MALNVETGHLRDLASGLSGLVGEIQTAGSQVISVDLGAAGHPTLIHALEGFQEIWAGAIQDMHEKVDLLSGNVVSAADAYDQVDKAVRAQFER